MMQRAFGLILLLLAAASFRQAQAEPRTWTSVSGATIEASLAGVEGSIVELAAPGGRRMQIQIDKLSQADRAYIHDVRQTEAPKTAGKTSEPRAQMPDKTAKVLFGGATIFEPEAVDVASLPPLELRNPGSATYWGAQIGPQKKDVAYFVFDRPGIDSLHDVLHVYSPGQPQYQKPVMIRAKRSKMKRGEDQYRVSRWTNISFVVKNGGLNTRFAFEFTYGLDDRPDFVATKTEIDLAGASGTSRVVTGGFLMEEIATGAGTLTPAKLLGPIDLSVTGIARTTSNSIQAKLAMGNRWVVPGRGMSEKIRVKISDPSGRVRERLKFELDEAILLRIEGGGLSTSVDKLLARTTYSIDATLDLGPVLGIVSSSREFTTKEPKKKE